MKTIIPFLLLLMIISCSRPAVSDLTESENAMITVSGRVYDNFVNQPIKNLRMYVYKPASLFGGVYKIVAETKTDANGRYSMQFQNKMETYLVSFDDSSDQFIFDSNNSEHFLESGFNVFDFKIRHAKTFKANIIITNNIYGPLSIYNNYHTESQTIPFGTTNTVKYFKADPLQINYFQMYVHEPDGHYWWKKEIFSYSGTKDTMEIKINADLKTFKRYARNENPGG